MNEERARRAAIFGSLADEYDRWRPEYPAEAVDWLIGSTTAQVADVGAGTGKLTGALVARGLRVTTVEPDPEMLEVLVRNYPHIDAHQADASSLPLPDSSVDVVTVAQAWHWFDHEKAVPEIRRILRADGWLAIVGNEPDPRAAWQHELLQHQPNYLENQSSEAPTVTGAPSDARVEWAIFPWTRHLTPQQLRADMATYSSYAIMEPAERDRRLDEAIASADAELARSGGTTVAYGVLARCARVHFARPASDDTPG